MFIYTQPFVAFKKLSKNVILTNSTISCIFCFQICTLIICKMYNLRKKNCKNFKIEEMFRLSVATVTVSFLKDLLSRPKPD